VGREYQSRIVITGHKSGKPGETFPWGPKLKSCPPGEQVDEHKALAGSREANKQRKMKIGYPKSRKEKKNVHNWERNSKKQSTLYAN